MQYTALFISALALATSLLTAWLTLLRRGEVKMTRPCYLYFGPHFYSPTDRRINIAFRTLLFCTSKRGRVIEFMYVTIRRNETRQNFTRWIMEEKDGGSLGSGLFVGEQGVTTTHHFFPPIDGAAYSFREGDYQIEIYAKLVNEAKPRPIFIDEVTIDAVHGEALKDPRTGVHFDWGPDNGKYIVRVE